MSSYFAENYQLKWHSHGVHLHSSVAGLHRSLSFADVSLVTLDGRSLSAHKFILSACSAYFSHLFSMRLASSPAGSNLVVVLPTEVSYQTLSILLQYMYSGEATVSNDQLSSVLKAGELLSIRGLCYNQSDGKSQKNSSSKGNNEGILTQRRNSNQTSDSEQNSKKEEENNQKDISRSESFTNLSNDGSDVENMKLVIDKDKEKNKVKKKEIEKKIEPSEKAEKSIVPVTKNDDCESEKDKNEPTLEEVVGVAENMQIELMIKEEPIEWNDSDGRMSAEDPEMRMEIYDGDEAEESHQFYAPLTCDMCGETFNTPALWVRHVETHPASEVPQRRSKRASADGILEDSNEFPPLRCELCQEIFTVPGDWVRHIQESHTDEQLALSNSLTKPQNNSDNSNAMLSTLNQRRRRILNSRKRCPICEKSFPSHASMLIHSRTHTGERPYICEHCEKGFNVKSNLLRHMRTLHDQMVTPLQF